jgi:predicted molibdopterin-dependent oxidoreductase YjgC
MSTIVITVDGEPLEARRGITVAASLLAAGRPGLRRSPRAAAPRGVHCGMGHCFECVVTIDGARGRRACLVTVRDGMTVETGP